MMSDEVTAMLLKECPMCGYKKMTEIPNIGYKCENCDEVFKYSEEYGYDIVSLEEWVGYLYAQNDNISSN